MTKKFFLIFVSLFLVFGLIQAQYSIQPRYEKQLRYYNHMKARGIVCLSLGAAFGAGSAALIIKGSEVGQNALPGETSDAEGYYALGLALGLLSIPCLIAGSIYTPIGISKSREYRKLIENLSVGIICTPKTQGISFSYRF
jgi:hypothetical protein